jgi:hypothetical protein
MPAFPLPVQSNPQEFRENGDERLINCFSEVIGANAKGLPIYRIRSLPGFTSFSDDVNNVNCRGAIEADGNSYLVFEGGNVVKIDSAGTRATIGYIGGTGPVDMARNGASPFQIGCVATDTGKYYVIQSNAVQLVDTRDLPAFNSICWVGGYFVLGVADGRFFSTDLNNATSINGLDYATAEGNPDGLIRVFANRLELVVMGEKSIEIWGLDSNPPATGSPFVRLGGAVLNKGCASALSAASIDNSYMWVGNDFKVYRNDNYNPVRVSHYGVERSIAAQADKTTIRGSRWQYKGNEFYQISGDDFTWIYNAATRLWSEGASYLKNRLNAEIYFEAWGNTYCTTKINGTVYKLDDTVFIEGSDVLPVVVRFPNAPRNVQMDNFEATFVSGRSAGTGTTNQTNPQIELKWSDDGGANWGNPRIFAMGKIGEYQKRIRALRLGNTGLKWGRRYELRVTDPHVVALTECRVNEAAV